MTKQEILKAALEARNQEVLGYQINIDNYTLAIERIDDMGDPDMLPFRSQLVSLLESEKLEQKKSKIMQYVISQQITPE